MRAAASLFAAILLVCGLNTGCDDEPSTADSADAERVADAAPAPDAAEPDQGEATDRGPAPDAASDVDATVDAEPPPDMGPPARLVLGAAQSVGGCDDVQIEVAADQGFGPVEWRIDGWPIVPFIADGPTTIRFRAPSVARETDLTVRAFATLDDGTAVQGAAIVTVAAPQVIASLAQGMALDCAPFPYGVASGEPHPDSVVLWTAVEPGGGDPVTLEWALARDMAFAEIVAVGEVVAEGSAAHTAQLEVDGLEPSTTYYYRFTAPDGASSTVGRTRTAPAGATERVTIASMSCSSVYSGWFNAYRRLAERDEVDLVVHLGDYIYDFVDGEEQIRLPMEPVVDPSTTEEWRDRHRFYLADPDLRAARAAHPWLVLWDNHDVSGEQVGPPDEVSRPIVAFREFVPMRQADPEDETIAYRTLRYGDLVEFILLDALRSRVEGDILGPAQWAFLEAALAAEGPAAWRVIGTQKLVSALTVPGGVIDVGNWEDYPASRTRLVESLAPLGDNILLAGDLHFTIFADLVANPSEPPYDPETGEGAVGVELLAASISRGNFDETICGGLCDDVNRTTIGIVGDTIVRTNPHIPAVELIEHGYGLIEITPERATASMHFSVIREPADEEAAGPSLVVERGANRWTRP